MVILTGFNLIITHHWIQSKQSLNYGSNAEIKMQLDEISKKIDSLSKDVSSNSNDLSLLAKGMITISNNSDDISSNIVDIQLSTSAFSSQLECIKAEVAGAPCFQ